MQPREFLDLVESLDSDDEWSELAYSLCGSYHESPEWWELAKKLREQGYELKSEDGYGGEGKGDKYWGVFSVTKDRETTYFRLLGYYASFYGPEIDAYDLEKVTKVPVTTYKWEKKE